MVVIEVYDSKVTKTVSESTYFPTIKQVCEMSCIFRVHRIYRTVGEVPILFTTSEVHIQALLSHEATGKVL